MQRRVIRSATADGTGRWDLVVRCSCGHDFEVNFDWDDPIHQFAPLEHSGCIFPGESLHELVAEIESAIFHSAQEAQLCNNEPPQTGDSRVTPTGSRRQDGESQPRSSDTGT